VEGGRDGVFTTPDATSPVRGCRIGEKSSGTLSKTRSDCSAPDFNSLIFDIFI
jgi:hypothetical protein